MPENKNIHKGGLAWSLLLHIAWQNLTSKKLRTALTVVGVTIGIGAIYFLLSFGIGLQELVTGEIIGNKSVKLVEVSSPNSKLVNLNQETVRKIGALAHVDETSASYSFPGILSYRGGEVDAVTYGIDDQYSGFITLNLSHGRMVKRTDSNQMVVNTSALETLGIKNPSNAVGQSIKMFVPIKLSDGKQKKVERDFEIVGVIDSGAGSEVFVSADLFTTAGAESYKTLRVLADDSDNVQTLRGEIESLGLETQSPADTLDQVNQIFQVFNAVMISFGSIGMLVAIIGMFNTITVSLLERTREIGLMVALGARRVDMRKLFILETTMISVIGAAIGIALAMIGGFILNFILNQFAVGRGVESSFNLFANPPLLIVGMILFMVVVGLLVSFLPARRAEKINPIDALRRE